MACDTDQIDIKVNNTLIKEEIDIMDNSFVQTAVPEPDNGRISVAPNSGDVFVAELEAIYVKSEPQEYLVAINTPKNMAMPKKKKDILTQVGKYRTASRANASRQQSYRDNLSPDALLEYRRKARERYMKRKLNKQEKSIRELSAKEQNERRKMWKTYSRKYRERKKASQQSVLNTPPESDPEIELPGLATAGRNKLRIDRGDVYREIKRQDKVIKELEKQVAKYKKILQRQKQKESPTPRIK